VDVQTEHYPQLLNGFQLIFVALLAANKTSALFFYHRVFGTSYSLRLRRTAMALGGLLMAWAVIFIVFFAVACGGVVPSLGVSAGFQQTFSFTDVLFDFLVLLIPLPSVWKLQLSRGRKIGISAIFLLATLGLLASIYRMVTVFDLATQFLGESLFIGGLKQPDGITATGSLSSHTRVAKS